MSYDINFGVKTSGLIHSLSTVVEQLNAIGYFNSHQAIFIQRYALKCDDALTAAYGFDPAITLNSPLRSETAVPSLQKSPGAATHALSANFNYLTSAVGAKGIETEVSVSEDVPHVVHHRAMDSQHGFNVDLKAEVLSESIEPHRVDGYPLGEHVVFEPYDEETRTAEVVCENNSRPENSGSSIATLGPILNDVDLDAANFSARIDPAGIDKTFKGSSNEAVQACFNEAGDGTNAVVPIPLEVPYTVTAKSSAILTEHEGEHAVNQVGEPPMISGYDSTHDEDEAFVTVQENVEAAVVDVVINIPSASDSIITKVSTAATTDGLTPLEAASIGSGSAIIQPSVSKDFNAAEELASNRTISPPLLNSAPIAPQIGSGSDQNGTRWIGITVRMAHTGFHREKKNIVFESRIRDDINRKHTCSTTYHSPGATLIALQNQRATRYQDGILPFLEIFRGDRLELLEQRSHNVYLVRQIGQRRLEGLVKISRNEMTAKQAEISSCLQNPTGNVLSSFVTGTDGLTEAQNKSSSSAQEGKATSLVKPTSPIRKVSPPPTPISTPKRASKTASKNSSPRSLISKPSDRPEYERSKLFFKAPLPCDPNAPHMKAIQAWQISTQTPYTQEIPQRHRFVDVWTPQAVWAIGASD